MQSRIHIVLALAAALWIGAALPSIATELTGIVKRRPADPPPTVSVSRYKTRGAPVSETKTGQCICNPGLYSVVYLMADSLPPITPPSQAPSMAQKDMMFQPAVLTVPIGSSVDFPNLDPYFHNVFSYSQEKKFDLGRYPQGKSRRVTFDKPGIIKVFCEIHYSMRAYIHVVPTPYCTTSDEHGVFVINDIKPGEYTLHVWQENLPDLARPITIQGDTVRVEVE